VDAKLNLTEGCDVRLRDGSVRGPLRCNDCQVYPWVDKYSGTTWTTGGSYLFTLEPRPQDIVAVIEKPQETPVTTEDPTPPKTLTEAQEKWGTTPALRSADKLRQAITHDFNRTAGKHNEHYLDSKVTPWDIIDDWGLGFYAGNVVKYLKRLGKKAGEDPVKDAEKLVVYAQKLLERVKETP